MKKILNIWAHYWLIIIIIIVLISLYIYEKKTLQETEFKDNPDLAKDVIKDLKEFQSYFRKRKM